MRALNRHPPRHLLRRQESQYHPKTGVYLGGILNNFRPRNLYGTRLYGPYLGPAHRTHPGSSSTSIENPAKASASRGFLSPVHFCCGGLGIGSGPVPPAGGGATLLAEGTSIAFTRATASTSSAAVAA